MRAAGGVQLRELEFEHRQLFVDALQNLRRKQATDCTLTPPSKPPNNYASPSTKGTPAIKWTSLTPPPLLLVPTMKQEEVVIL